VTRVDTVIVGGGQAGLALSRLLAESGQDHVVLERGRVAERWRSERWDSFRLLTPNWLTRLPGHSYVGPDPNGFMTKAQIIRYFDAYADTWDADIRTGVTVSQVARTGLGWRVQTNEDVYDADNVVAATGHYGTPRVPSIGAALPGSVDQVLARDYRNPSMLTAGGVLVVGAGPTGQQIASELARAGREVYLATGQHRPLPRNYRGRDAYWWLEQMGALSRTVDTLEEPERTAGAPSVVLQGGSDDLDLHRLAAEGVTPVGHLVDVNGQRLVFAPDLAGTLAAADAHAERFRAQVDNFVGADRTPERLQTPEWVERTPTQLDMRSAAITTVVWATGYRRDYSWIEAPVFTSAGEPAQRRGITAAPGLYFLGLRFMYRRNSNFIDGVAADAAYLARHLTGAMADPAVA
jgi:putative flavoprotein involved in K+ transport